jgi:hypothetical protein
MFDEELRTRHERKNTEEKTTAQEMAQNNEMKCLLVTRRTPAESETPQEKKED